MDFTVYFWIYIIAEKAIKGVVGEADNETEFSSSQVRLVSALFTEGRYDSRVRPVRSNNTKTTVQMNLTINQIRELSEKKQVLTLAVWAIFTWHDELLTWDPRDYGGFEELTLPSSSIWLPDIVLYNSMDEERGFTEIWNPSNVIIAPDGNVTWLTIAQTQSACSLDISEYPFDSQLCPLKFGSWTYKVHQLDIESRAEQANTEIFNPNEEWELNNVRSIRHELRYPSGGLFSDLTFYVNIKRKPNFYMYNLFFPCVVLLIISTAVFFLPTESGEKVALGVTVLLAMTVYQLIVADYIPHTSEYVPLLAQFFGASVVLLSFSVMSSVLVLNVHFYGSYGARLPYWLRRILLHYVTKVLCMKTYIAHFIKKSEAYEARNMMETEETSSSPHNEITNNGWGSKQSPLKETHDINDHRTENHIGATLKQKLQGSHSASAHASGNAAEHAQLCQEEWQLAAVVMDRLLFLVFAIFTVIISVIIFTLRPVPEDMYARLARKGY